MLFVCFPHRSQSSRFTANNLKQKVAFSLYGMQTHMLSHSHIHKYIHIDLLYKAQGFALPACKPPLPWEFLIL